MFCQKIKIKKLDKRLKYVRKLKFVKKLKFVRKLKFVNKLKFCQNIKNLTKNVKVVKKLKVCSKIKIKLRYFEAYSITQIIQLCTCLLSAKNLLIFSECTENIFLRKTGFWKKTRQNYKLLFI